MKSLYFNIDPLRECPRCGQNRVRANESSLECLINVPSSSTPGFTGASQRWVQTFECECDTTDCWNIWTVTVTL